VNATTWPSSLMRGARLSLEASRPALSVLTRSVVTAAISASLVWKTTLVPEIASGRASMAGSALIGISMPAVRSVPSSVITRRTPSAVSPSPVMSQLFWPASDSMKASRLPSVVPAGSRAGGALTRTTARARGVPAIPHKAGGGSCRTNSPVTGSRWLSTTSSASPSPLRSMPSMRSVTVKSLSSSRATRSSSGTGGPASSL
jgi:hypothetical protein